MPHLIHQQINIKQLVLWTPHYRPALDTCTALFNSFQCIGSPNRGCPSLWSETKFVSQELIAAIA